MFLCKFLGERISQIWWVNTKERKLLDCKIRVSLISQDLSIDHPEYLWQLSLTLTVNENFAFFYILTRT